MQSGKRKRKAQAGGEFGEDGEEEDYTGAQLESDKHEGDGKTPMIGPFTGTGADLARSVRSGSIDLIREALSQLRYSTSLKAHDERIAASDSRVQLAAQYIAADGIGDSQTRSDLLQAWNYIHEQKLTSLLPLPMFALSNLIAILGAHQPNHSLVEGLVLAILPKSSTTSGADSQTNQYWDYIQLYLSTVAAKKEANGKAYHQAQASTDVIVMASIRLLLELTSFAGGKYARAVFDSMNWNMRSLPRLLNMRRRHRSVKKGAKSSAKEREKRQVTLDRPDIRTLWVLFLLSFLQTKSGNSLPASVQVSALSLGKDFLPAILRGLDKDSSQVVIHVLMVLHDALLSDDAASKLPRSRVSGFFSEWACKELLSLYDREDDMVSIAGTEETHSIADVIHHFMLALCTHPGRGVCYKDQGWYGRQRARGVEEEDGEDEPSKESGVYNKILLGLLKSLAPTRSVKQAELSLRILQSSQELLAPYLNSAGGALSSSNVEPRPVSIAWLGTTAFLGRVLSIPLPLANDWKSAPPPLHRCLESLLPASVTRAALQRGLQHKDRLTRHAALLLLSRMLARATAFEELCAVMAERCAEQDEKTRDGDDAEAASKVDSDDEMSLNNPWTRLLSTVLEAVRLRSPDMSTILDSVTYRSSARTATDAESDKSNKEQPQSTLLAEAALRAATYHFGLFSSASLSDITMLLASTSLSSADREAVEGASKQGDDAPTLALMCQMHTIQLLTKDPSQTFGLLEFHNRQGGSAKAPLRSLLHLATSSTSDQVRHASWQLIGSTMTNSVLFEQHAIEWSAWQYALQHGSTEILDFFDECVQRCLKTPYRYFEMARDQLPADCVDFHVSPIFFTMLEQYFIRLQNGIFGMQEMRVAFPRFLSYFMPALHSVQDGSDLQEIRAAGISLSRGAMGRLRDALSSNKDPKGKDRNHASKEEQEEIVSSFVQAHYGICVLIEGSQRKIEAVVEGDGLADLLGGYALVFNASVSNPVLRFLRMTNEQDSVLELDVPELSLEETRILITYCRNCLILNTLSIREVQRLLQKTLQLGTLSPGRELLDVFAHEQVLSHCRKSPERMGMLVSTLSLTPLGWKHGTEKDERCAIPSILLSTAIKTAFENRQGETRLLRECLVAAFPFLQNHDKMKFWQSEQDVDLLCEAGLNSTEEFLVGTPDVCVETILEVVKVGTTDLRLKGLLLLRASLAHEGFDLTDDMENDRAVEEAVKLIVAQPDAPACDVALSIVLEVSKKTCHYFWRTIIENDSDAKEVARRLPYSLACASTVLPPSAVDGTEWEPIVDLKNGVKKFGKSLLASFFGFEPGVAPIIAQVLEHASRYVDAEGYMSAKILLDNLPAQPSRIFRPEVLLYVATLIDRHQGEAFSRALLTAILDNTCLWLVRRFAEDDEDSRETLQGVEALMLVLFKCASYIELKAHLVQPVLTAIVANRRRSLLHLRLTNRLMAKTLLKEGVMGRLLTDIMTDAEVMSDADRCDEVVDMLYYCVAREPHLCDADLVKLALSMYKGSLAESDRKLMSIFHLYEESSKSSITDLLHLHWKKVSYQATNDIDLGILSRLDSGQIHETCLKFPRGRSFDDMVASGFGKELDTAEIQGAVYDPLLIISVVGDLLTGGHRLSGLHWLELARTNAMGVVVCCLSSTSMSTRAAARAILARARSSVQSLQFQEKELILLILDYARNSYRGRGEEDDEPYLPLTTTLFIAYAVRSLGTPSLYLYPLISRFLLQRPLPDPTDVPLLYTFLYSSSTQSTTYQAEKAFMLRYILSCITYGGKAEWLVLKRRHVWDSLCSMYASEDPVGSFKRVIENIFLAISRKPDFAYRIVVRHAFLQYLGQLQQSQDTTSEESRKKFIAQCVANLLQSLDLDRLEKAMNTGYMIPFAELLAPLISSSYSNTDWVMLYNILVSLERLKSRNISVQFDAIEHLFPERRDDSGDLASEARTSEILAEKERDSLYETKCRGLTLTLFGCESRRSLGASQPTSQPFSCLFADLLEPGFPDVDTSPAYTAELPGNERTTAMNGFPGWTLGLGSIFSSGN